MAREEHFLLSHPCFLVGGLHYGVPLPLPAKSGSSEWATNDASQVVCGEVADPKWSTHSHRDVLPRDVNWLIPVRVHRGPGPITVKEKVEPNPE